ncbi:MAG TPA: homoserine dehydrogenase [Myxococcales bacterium]|nr:homoserine dehydrogenase [Myxococcales bacterium]
MSANLAPALHAIYAALRRGERACAPPELRAALLEAGIAAAVELVPGAPLPRLPEPARPLRVALLGHGTVGGGVYRRMLELPRHFSITGVAVRDPRRHAIVTDDRCWRVLRKPCDAVVELMGGTSLAAHVIEASLKEGRHVVTANKAVMALHGPRLEALARARGVRLLDSASVGGAMPALETVRRLSGSVQSLSGVLNGTCNFVLDELGRGVSFRDAVLAAQRAGYAENDPTLDLDGTDAAQKLVVLARAAFGHAPPLARKVGIQGLSARRVQAARARGNAIRLVAACTRERAEVAPCELPLSHPLADCAGAENRLLVDGLLLRGAGAGRWPTAQAVLADLLDLAALSAPRRKSAA